MPAPKARKRICVVTGGHWAKVMGGAQFQAKCLVEELVRTGDYEVFYLARHVSPDYRPDGYRIFQTGTAEGIRRYGLFFDALRLSRLLTQLRPDVIYQRALQSYTGVVADYARRHGARFVFHIASDQDVARRGFLAAGQTPWSRVERSIGLYGLRRADAVVAQTGMQAELLRRNHGREADLVLPNFHPHPREVIAKPAAPLNVLWVANFKPVKRPELFVRLAEDLRHLDGVRFTMIGRPGPIADYGDLHRRIRRLPNLTHAGECPLEEVDRALAAGHLLVSTSSIEGFPNTFIQAWLREVPVVSLGVNPDGVFHRERIGYCADDYEALRSAVVRMVCDEHLRRECGSRAKRYAMAHHSMGNARQLMALFANN